MNVSGNRSFNSNCGRHKRNDTTRAPPTKKCRSSASSKAESDIASGDNWVDWFPDWSSSNDFELLVAHDGMTLGDIESGHVEVALSLDDLDEFVDDSASDDCEIGEWITLNNNESGHVEVAQKALDDAQALLEDAHVSIASGASFLRDGGKSVRSVESSAQLLLEQAKQTYIDSLTGLLEAKALSFLERVNTGQLKTKAPTNELPANFRQNIRLAVATKIDTDGIACPIDNRALNTCAAVFIIRFAFSNNTRENLVVVPELPGQKPKVKHLQGVAPACTAFKLPSRRTLRREVYRSLGFPSSGTSAEETFWFLRSDFTNAKKRMLYFTHAGDGTGAEEAGQGTC